MKLIKKLPQTLIIGEKRFIVIFMSGMFFRITTRLIMIISISACHNCKIELKIFQPVFNRQLKKNIFYIIIPSCSKTSREFFLIIRCMQRSCASPLYQEQTIQDGLCKPYCRDLRCRYLPISLVSFQAT